MTKVTSVRHRRREPDEIPIARVAIRNFCLECVGYLSNEVDLCTAPKCWVYPWRLGRTPPELKAKGHGNLNGLRKARASRLQT